jgi:Ca2+-binding EF-hand superfamily protein
MSHDIEKNKREKVKNELNENDIEYIMANTDFDKENILKWFTEFKSHSPNLKIDKKQFIIYYKKFLQSDNNATEEFCSLVFQVFDYDHNGFIDFRK